MKKILSFLVITCLLIGCETEMTKTEINMSGYIVSIEQKKKYLIVEDNPSATQAPEAILTTIDNKTLIFSQDKPVTEEALSTGTKVLLQSTRGDIHKSYPALAVANEIHILPDPSASLNITRREAIKLVLDFHTESHFVRKVEYLEEKKLWSIEIAPLGDFTEDDILRYHVDGKTAAISKP